MPFVFDADDQDDEDDDDLDKWERQKHERQRPIIVLLTNDQS